MAAGLSDLTFAVAPVVVNTGTDAAPVYGLNTTGLAAGTLVVAFVDPTSSQRIFDPFAEGVVAPSSGLTLSDYLPAVASLTAAQVTDSYWAAIPGVTDAVNDIGQVTLKLTPGPLNTVEAASVMTFKLSPQALVITTSSTTLP